MTTKTLKLEVIEDENGCEGFALVDAPRTAGMAASLDGALIAHDVLEHVNGPRMIGSIGDELEALGAVVFVRGQAGALEGLNTRPSHEHLASDIAELARLRMDNIPLRAPLPGEHGAEPSDMDWLIATSIDHAYFNNDIDRYGLSTKQAADYQDFFTHDALVIMRRGFRKAEALYGDWADVSETFIAITHAVNGAASDLITYKGLECVLTYDVDARTASVEALDYCQHCGDAFTEDALIHHDTCDNYLCEECADSQDEEDTANAFQSFKNELAGPVASEYPNDEPAMVEAWNDFTDGLCKDGLLTANAYHECPGVCLTESGAVELSK